MLAKKPQVTRLDVNVGLVRDRRDLVGITEDRATDAVLLAELRQQRVEGLVGRCEAGQQRREGVPLGGPHRRQGIETGKHQPLLLLGQLDVRHGHAGLTAADRQLHPKVPVDHVARGPVHEHLCHPANLRQRARKGLLQLLGVQPPVGRVRQELLRGVVAMADDPVAPGDGRCRHLRHRPCIAARGE